MLRKSIDSSQRKLERRILKSMSVRGNAAKTAALYKKWTKVDRKLRTPAKPPKRK